MRLNYKCFDCGFKWATKHLDEDYCPNCGKNGIGIISKSGGKSAYDLS